MGGEDRSESTEQMSKALAALLSEVKNPNPDIQTFEDLKTRVFDNIATELPEREAAAFRSVMEMRLAISRESDRGAALYISAYIDWKLGKVLESYLVSSKDVSQQFIHGNGPLSTFSSRIDLAYLLGIISPEERHDLNIIRKIRNDFAHNYNDIGFREQSIGAKCRNFKIYSPYNKLENPEPRNVYIGVALSLIATLDFFLKDLKNLEEKQGFDELNKQVREFWESFWIKSRESETGKRPGEEQAPASDSPLTTLPDFQT